MRKEQSGGKMRRIYNVTHYGPSEKLQPGESQLKWDEPKELSWKKKKWYLLPILKHRSEECLLSR